MVGHICVQDHLCNDLPDIPILSFTQKLKNVVLRIKQQFESDGAMMILKDTDIIIPESLLMLDANQKVVIDPRMSNIVQETSQEACHHLKVGEMGHQLSILHEVVEVSSGVDHTQRVVELSRLIALIFYREKKVLKVVVRN
jgi:hypothetical protein